MKKRIIAALLCGALASAAWGQDLAATQVASISTDNLNLGGMFLTFNWTTEAENIGLLQFDLSGRGAVASAQLNLYHLFNSGDGAVFELYANTAAWQADIADWAAQPARQDTAAAQLRIDDPADHVWRGFDVTATVNSWISGALPNHGFTLKRVDQLNPYVYFSSAAEMGGEAPVLSLAPVPEPTTALLLAAGVLVIGWRRHVVA